MEVLANSIHSCCFFIKIYFVRKTEGLDDDFRKFLSFLKFNMRYGNSPSGASIVRTELVYPAKRVNTTLIIKTIYFFPF